MLTIIENDRHKAAIRLKAESHSFDEIINKIDELTDYIQKSNVKGILLENALADLSFWKEVLAYKETKKNI